MRCRSEGNGFGDVLDKSTGCGWFGRKGWLGVYLSRVFFFLASYLSRAVSIS